MRDIPLFHAVRMHEMRSRPVPRFLTRGIGFSGLERYNYTFLAVPFTEKGGITVIANSHELDYAASSFFDYLFSKSINTFSLSYALPCDRIVVDSVAYRVNLITNDDRAEIDRLLYRLPTSRENSRP
ncbi:hypothetical protein HYZ97_02455 [Candidatus Pacearchaeota archaeon]|nr:hypothetical protein [Candidatus Pacearchaeota archaeon]